MPRNPTKTIADFETDAVDVVDKRTEPREFYHKQDEQGLYRIHLTGGGMLPESLLGRWTNAIKAQAAIDNYITTREQMRSRAEVAQ